MRPLTHAESSAVRTLGNLIADDAVRNQFLIDINEVEVTEESPDGSRLLFHIPGVQIRPYQGQDSFRGRDGFPVEGQLLDADGACIEVYFYHVKGRMFELELVRPDGQPVSSPNWASFAAK